MSLYDWINSGVMSDEVDEVGRRIIEEERSLHLF